MQERTSLPEPLQSVVSQVMQVGSRVQPFSIESHERLAAD